KSAEWGRGRSKLLVFPVRLCLSSASGPRPLESCFEDPEYGQLLEIAKDGLGKAEKPKRIVIVGAGIAGLTAGKVLLDAGHQVTILEARSHVGGRMETYRDPAGNWYVDLGPRRLPYSHRIVREFVKKFGLKLHLNNIRARVKDVEKNPDILGYPVDPSERGKSAVELYYQALRAVSCHDVISLCPLLTSQEYLIEKGNLSRAAVQMIGDLMNLSAEFSCSFIEFLREPSLLSLLSRFDELAGGFDTLPRAFHQSLPAATVLLNSTVVQVLRERDVVSVLHRPSNSRAPPSTLQADYVIVTSTAEATRLIQFHPALSTAKTQALRSLHSTGATKVALACTKKFWEEEGEEVYGGTSISDLPSRITTYSNQNFSNGLGVIIGSQTYGEDSEFFAPLSPQRTVEVVLRDLAAIHQRPLEELRQLCSQWVVKKWNLDPHAMGAFTLFRPYQLSEHAAALAGSEGRVYFAGEYTALPHGWVDTAMKSALRAAREVHRHCSHNTGDHISDTGSCREAQNLIDHLVGVIGFI
uniref:Amine oxidase n=1 Tax=Varanus komodoensis TaxID=61221 RepID=A0A8D2LAZ9_VARKO